MTYPVWYDFFLIVLFFVDGWLVWKLIFGILEFLFGKIAGGCLGLLAMFFLFFPVWFVSFGIIGIALDKIFFGGHLL